jgi:hypothetical protein
LAWARPLLRFGANLILRGMLLVSSRRWPRRRTRSKCGDRSGVFRQYAATPISRSGAWQPNLPPAMFVAADRRHPSFGHVVSARPRDGPVCGPQCHMRPPRVPDAATVYRLARHMSRSEPLGAVYTEGWDRRVVARGAAAKRTKDINALALGGASAFRQNVISKGAVHRDF